MKKPKSVARIVATGLTKASSTIAHLGVVRMVLFQRLAQKPDGAPGAKRGRTARIFVPVFSVFLHVSQITDFSQAGVVAPPVTPVYRSDQG